MLSYSHCKERATLKTFARYLSPFNYTTSPYTHIEKLIFHSFLFLFCCFCIHITTSPLALHLFIYFVYQTINVDNYSTICILGGDGTVHESINGYMEREDDARLRVPLSVLPGKFLFLFLLFCCIYLCLKGGTGNSFVLEIQGEVKLKTAVEHIIRGLSCSIDISKVFFPSNETSIFLFNSLHWGMASNVNMMAEQLRYNPSQSSFFSCGN